MKKRSLIILTLAVTLVLSGCSAAASGTGTDLPAEGMVEIKKGGEKTGTVKEIEEEAAEIKEAKIPMVMVNGKMYYSTGKESTITARCGVMDGEITSTVDGGEIPTENNQSNFGSGYGYQYGMDDTIEVCMDGKWYVYQHGSGEGEILIDGCWYDKGFLGEETLKKPWGVTLSVKDVTKTGLALVFIQSDGNPTGELSSGSYYKLEVLNGNVWEPVPYATGLDEVWWTQEAWMIPMNDTVERQMDWSFLYGELPEGVYRIEKEITDFRKTADYDKQSCYAVFTIEE